MPVTVKKVFQALLIILVFLGLALTSAVITMKAVTWGRTVTVPDVRGMELTAAINQIRNSGLDIKVEREEHHPTVPQNYIIGQNPAPGERVKTGRNVMVVVSQGSEEVAVPSLTDKVFRLAQVALKQAGLVLGEAARVNSPAPSETVILQSPLPGTILQKGTEVDMLISAGGRGTRYVTPDLTGMTLPQAGDAVRPMGGKVLYSGKGGTIASQDPKAGYQLPANGQIIVSLGTRAAPKPQEKAPAPATPKQPAAQGPKPEKQAAQSPKPEKPAPQPVRQEKPSAAKTPVQAVPQKTNKGSAANRVLNPMGL